LTRTATVTSIFIGVVINKNKANIVKHLINYFST
jgi:hypothetical protein